MIAAANDPAVWGLILAGGEGKRLQPFIHRLRGDSLPKQFVNFIGRRSMLEHTFARAERIIPRERLFTVVSRDHLRYADVRRQLSDRAPGTIVVQPENRETGPGVLLPLVHIGKRYPGSAVVVFPSDHYIREEGRFVRFVAQGVRAALRDPDRFVLLAMEPTDPEPEYGYLMPGKKIAGFSSLGLRQVASFVEKPQPFLAHEIVARGGLWNTMIMVFHIDTLLAGVREVCPRLHAAFCEIHRALGCADETAVVEKVYRDLTPVNFSKDIIEPLASRRPSPLAVLPIRRVAWSDWGSEDRLMSALEKGGREVRPLAQAAAGIKTSGKVLRDAARVPFYRPT